MDGDKKGRADADAQDVGQGPMMAVPELFEHIAPVHARPHRPVVKAAMAWLRSFRLHWP